MGDFKRLSPDFNGSFDAQKLNAYLIELNRRIATSGGGFTAGGDLEGTSTEQTVAAIRTMPTPEAATASPFDFLRVSGGLGLRSPRSCVADGGFVWVGEHTQDEASGSGRVSVVDAEALELVTQIDLAAEYPAIDNSGVRDMAQDDTYVYCACWSSKQIAIIRKADNAIVGWATINAASGFAQAVSVCADNAGSFYVCGQHDESWHIYKFTTAACLGQPPNTVEPVLSEQIFYGPRKIRYGLGALFLANGGKGDGSALHKANPVNLLETGTFSVPAPAETDFGMDCLVAFGSVWVTNNDRSFQAMYRVNPATMALEATIPFSPMVGENINCIGLGPDDEGAANARLLVNTVDNTQTQFVVDPGTDSIETTFDIPNSGGEQICSQGDRYFVASPVAAGNRPDLYCVEGAAGLFTLQVGELHLIYDPADASTMPYVSTYKWPPPGDPVTVGEALDRLAEAVFAAV